MKQFNDHTPLPWGVDEYEGLVYYDDDQKGVKYPDMYSNVASECEPEDAAFILHACSLHYELVAALEQAQNALQMLVDTNTIENTSVVNAYAVCIEAETKARQLIKKAKGE